MGKFVLKEESVKFGLTEDNHTLIFEFDRLKEKGYIAGLLEFLAINESEVTGELLLGVRSILELESATIVTKPRDLVVKVKDGVLSFVSSHFDGVEPNVTVNDFIQFFVDLGYSDPRPEIQWGVTDVSLDNLAALKGYVREPSWREFFYPREGLEERYFVKDGVVLYFDTGEDQLYHFNEEGSFSFDSSRRPLAETYEEVIHSIRQGINFEIAE